MNGGKETDQLESDCLSRRHKIPTDIAREKRKGEEKAN